MYLNQIKSTPWEWVCDMTDSFRAMTVQIGFSHREDETDETEFCIDTFNDQELAELFDAFCKENDFEDVKVNYISVVRVAASMDELTEIEEGVVEDFETCPVCGGAIEPRDGEDDVYGELHLYWKCDNCGHSGTAIIDEHDNNAFIGHEIDW